MSAFKFKYFNGERELTHVYYDSKLRKHFGRPEGVEPVFTKEKGWFADHVEAERVIQYKKQGASKHKCDARCLNATGRVMKCECSCGGKNHGRGNFMAEEV